MTSQGHAGSTGPEPEDSREVCCGGGGVQSGKDREKEEEAWRKEGRGGFKAPNLHCRGR